MKPVWQAELILESDCRSQRSQSLFHIVGAAEVSDTVGIGDLGCPKACIVPLVERQGLSWFQGECAAFAFCVCSPVYETGPEATAGFLEGRASACPMVSLAGSWPSGGHGLV